MPSSDARLRVLSSVGRWVGHASNNTYPHGAPNVLHTGCEQFDLFSLQSDSQLAGGSDGASGDSTALARYNAAVGRSLSPFFIKPNLKLSVNNTHYLTHESGNGPVAFFLLFENKGSPITQLEIMARIWRVGGGSLSGTYLPLAWRGRSPFEEVKESREDVWPKLIKNETVFAWLAYQQPVGGGFEWYVPFEASAPHSPKVEEAFQVDLLVSWHKGEEEVGRKYWGFPMKVETDKLVIGKITEGS